MDDFRQFICRVCGVIYDEALGDPDGGLAAGTRFDAIPEDWACPVCGVGKADFEPYVPVPTHAGAAAAPALPGPRQPGVVIVGAGRAGWQVAQALRERDAALPITLVTACSGDVYDKPQLSVAVARGIAPAQLVREPAAAAAARLGVRLMHSTHAVAIDAPRRRLRTTRGTLRYRALVLAQGAQPALPPALPADRVWRVNDLAAYRRLRSALGGGAPRRLVIVGAGLVGCELANDLALDGHQVTLLDQQPLPLARQLPAEASRRLLQAWQALPAGGIDFIGGAAVAAVTGARPGPQHVCLADGRVIEADQVIAATGLRTCSRLAASAGLAFDQAAGGIVVDRAGASSVAGIHALGDCVVEDGRAQRFIDVLLRQAERLAAALAPGGDAAASGARAAADAPPAPLRIKTSSLPITLGGHWPQADSAAWQAAPGTADASASAAPLHLVQHDAHGRELAWLRAAALPS